MIFTVASDSTPTANNAGLKALPVSIISHNDISMVDENVDDEVEMSPIEINNSQVPGGFADAYYSPESEVDSIKDQVTSLSMEENTSDVQAIIDDYNTEVSFPVRMITTPSPSRSILRKISKYDTAVTMPSTVGDKSHKVPIVSDDSVLPPQTDNETQGYPVKIRRMSSSGSTMSSAAVILDNLKSALKMTSRKMTMSASSSASSSTTSLVECGLTTTKASRSLRFNANVLVGETFHVEEYDRTPGEMAAKRLTAQVAALIKRELNEFKGREMVVHHESRCNTVFYPL